MSLSLHTFLHERLSANQIAHHLAAATHLSISQTQAAINQSIDLIFAEFMATYQQHGVDAAESLLYASPLQNIDRDQTFDQDTVLLARDTGRPLFDKLYTNETQRQSIIATLATTQQIESQAAQDILFAVITLSLRELAILVHDSQIDSAGLADLLNAQTSLAAPDIATTPSIHQADNPVLNRLPDPVEQVAEQRLNPTIQPIPKSTDPAEEAPAVQTHRQHKQSSFLSKYALHAVFAILVLIPLLVFWRSCSQTQQESIQRANDTPAVIDTGMNAPAQSVVPNIDSNAAGEAPTSPAANEIVPNNGNPATTPLPTQTPALDLPANQAAPDTTTNP